LKPRKKISTNNQPPNPTAPFFMDIAFPPPLAERPEFQALRKNTPNAAEKYPKKQVKTLRAESDEFFILGVE
jgi:hypothetical protein